MPAQKGIAHILLVALLGVGILATVFFWPKEKGSHKTTFDNVAVDSGGCEENINPTFERFPVDLEVVESVSPPIMQIADSPKSHSYINVTETGPVYAPVDGVLVGGAKYEENFLPNAPAEQYTLLFSVTCEVSYYFDHLVNPPECIAALFPGEAQGHTSSNAKFSLPIKAGEIVGYSWHGQFDFGVLNAGKPPTMANFPGFEMSEKAYADCPFDYFEEDIQNFIKPISHYNNLGNDLVYTDNLCE